MGSISSFGAGSATQGRDLDLLQGKKGVGFTGLGFYGFRGCGFRGLVGKVLGLVGLGFLKFLS